MFDYRKLYGKIKEVFNSQEAFAEALGMSKSALSLRLTQRVEWKATEMEKAARVLGFPVSEIHLYFFCVKSLEIQD